MHAGEHIRAAREALGISQPQLAEAVGVAPSHVSRIESGQRSLSLELLVAIARVLGIDLGVLSPGAEDDDAA